jgi:hypothetical protein
MKSLWGSCAGALMIMLLVQTTAAAQSPKSLSLVLLLGEMNGPPVAEDVPMSARKALDELRGFLPFKSYRLYDTGVIGMPSETLPAVVRLRGATIQGQASQLVEVQVMRPKFSQSLDVALRDVGQPEAAKPAPGAAGLPVANLMAASVRVNAGETVVVGASRVRGDKALVLLITGIGSSLGAPESNRTTTRTPSSAAPFIWKPLQPLQLQPPAQPGQSQVQPVQPPQPPQPAAQPAPQPRLAPAPPQPARVPTVPPATPAVPAAPAPATPQPLPQ